MSVPPDGFWITYIMYIPFEWLEPFVITQKFIPFSFPFSLCGVLPYLCGGLPYHHLCPCGDSLYPCGDLFYLPCLYDDPLCLCVCLPYLCDALCFFLYWHSCLCLFYPIGWEKQNHLQQIEKYILSKKLNYISDHWIILLPEFKCS